MFYFFEIYYRGFFYVLFNIMLFGVLYLYKELILWITVFPLILINYTNNFQTHFIYTHPTELFYIIFYLLFIFCIIINLIYIFLILLDFFKTSLCYTKFIFFQKINFYFFFLIVIFNVFFILYIIPFVFCFFESYNTADVVNLNLNRELRIKSYVNFFIEYLIISNFIFYFLIIIFIIIFSFNLLFFLKNKKFFSFINILVATLFSPPDVISQILLFVLLSLLIEFLFLILIFKLKFSKVTY